MLETNGKIKKMKHFEKSFKQGNNKNAKKFKGNCYNCGKARHRSNECCKPRKQALANVSELNTLSDRMSHINLLAIV